MRPKEGPSMEGALQDRGTLQGIARTLLALALLAERSAARSLPVRFLVLVILGRAEAIARRFVARTAATVIAEAIDAGCPDFPFPDLSCLDEPTGMHYGAADAVLLALRLRILAAVLGMFSDAEDSLDDRAAAFVEGRWGVFSDDGFGGCPSDGSAYGFASASGSVRSAPRIGVAFDFPLLLIVSLPAALRPPQPP
jgi:hypothetical protein